METKEKGDNTMWKVTVVYEDGANYKETLADERAMIEFASNLETDNVIIVKYTRQTE